MVECLHGACERVETFPTLEVFAASPVLRWHIGSRTASAPGMPPDLKGFGGREDRKAPARTFFTALCNLCGLHNKRPLRA
jgi:hypothetical protein